MSVIKAWQYYWRISKEALELRKTLEPNDHCANNSMEWALLTLTEDGLFACVSDYGDYIHHWPASYRVKGQDFREFVQGISGHYLLGKTREEKQIDAERSAEPLRMTVKSLRECHNNWLKEEPGQFGIRDTKWCEHGEFAHLDHEKHTAEWATECLDLLDNLTQENLNELYYQLDLPIGSDDIRYTYSPQALTFAKYVLPELQKMIRSELANERMEAARLLRGASQQMEG